MQMMQMEVRALSDSLSSALGRSCMDVGSMRVAARTVVKAYDRACNRACACKGAFKGARLSKLALFVGQAAGAPSYHDGGAPLNTVQPLQAHSPPCDTERRTYTGHERR